MEYSILSPGILYAWLMQRKKLRLASVWAVDVSRISWDAVGVGRDFKNHLSKRGLGDARPYAGSGRCQAPKAYVNLRTWAAWALERRLDPERHTDDRYPTSSRQPPFHIPLRA